MGGSSETDSREGLETALAPLREGQRQRTRLRAALALEDAGELTEAARMFEQVGEHAQAAALRLEHARTLRDEEQRLAVLREGAARNPGVSEQGRALHRSLARALLVHAESLPDGARRRGLLVEAAQALQEADEAGELYERLGLLDRAARSYEEAGAITQLELVLHIIERREQAAESLRQIERDIDTALREGQRRLAHALLAEHAHERRGPVVGVEGARPRLGLVRRLAELERNLPRPRQLSLRHGAPGVEARSIRLRFGERFRIGRSPEVELPMPGAAISREHVVLSVHTSDDGDLGLMATDQGSRAGSFWDGEPLEPGEPLELQGPGELGLGFATPLHIEPRFDAEGHAVVLLGAPAGRDPLAPEWTVFMPLGGPLWVDPGRRIPAQLHFEPPCMVLDADPGVQVRLFGAALGHGARVGLLVHDRPQLGAGPELATLEVLA